MAVETQGIKKYSDQELLRLIEQFSHAEEVEKELYRRYCEGILSAITLPASMLDKWRERKML